MIIILLLIILPCALDEGTTTSGITKTQAADSGLQQTDTRSAAVGSQQTETGAAEGVSQQDVTSTTSALSEGGDVEAEVTFRGTTPPAVSSNTGPVNPGPVNTGLVSTGPVKSNVKVQSVEEHKIMSTLSA